MSTAKNSQYPLFSAYYQTYNWILDKMELMPRKIKFTVSDRIVVISTEILEQIIEAIYSKEKKIVLTQINLRLEKLRIFFRLLFERHHISEKQYLHICEKLDECGKMTGGWLKQCNE